MHAPANLQDFSTSLQIAELKNGAASEVRDYLSADAASHVFMLSWLENYGVRAPRRPDLFGFRVVRADGRVVGTSLLITRRLVLLHADDPSVARSLASHYRDHGLVLEHIVSRRQSVAPFWAEYGSWSDVQARLLRDQELYVAERGEWLRQHPARRTDGRSVRLATLSDIDAVFLASAKMHTEETLEDPLARNAEHFRRHVEHRIENGRTYVLFDEHRRLLFKADVSAQSEWGAQISGVYTPASHRGQGIATRAMHEICENLFERGFPRVTLYVNRTNPAALRVYQKVGFRFHTDYQTVFIQASP